MTVPLPWNYLPEAPHFCQANLEVFLKGSTGTWGSCSKRYRMLSTSVPAPPKPLPFPHFQPPGWGAVLPSHELLQDVPPLLLHPWYGASNQILTYTGGCHRQLVPCVPSVLDWLAKDLSSMHDWRKECQGPGRLRDQVSATTGRVRPLATTAFPMLGDKDLQNGWHPASKHPEAFSCL